MFQVSFTKHKTWLRDMILCGHIKKIFRWLKGNFYPHLVNFVFLTAEFWTVCLQVDFQPTAVDSDLISVLCFRETPL